MKRSTAFALFFLFVLLCGALVFLWLVPVLVLGSSFDIYHILEARLYATAGRFVYADALGRYIAPSISASVQNLSASHGRLTTEIVAYVSRWIPWGDLARWAYFSAAAFVLCLPAIWLITKKLFDYRIAWMATILFALFPIYWRQAIWLDQYTFCLLFLFWGIALFLILQERSFWTALVLFSVFFGLSASAKDVPLIFIPWVLVAFVYLHRRVSAKAVTSIVLFGVIAGGIYLFPYIHDIRTVGYPVNQNLARLWPGGAKVANETYLHLYPDPYTYFFDKERFDTEYLATISQSSFLQRIRSEKVILAYGLGKGALRSFMLGTWLLLQDIPSLVQRQNAGGVLPFFFIVIGAYMLYKRRPRLWWVSFGLVLSSLVIIRYAMGYERSHFVAFGWILAIMAALGVMEVASGLQDRLRLSHSFLLALVFAALCAELLQANRYELAELYRKSAVPTTLATSASLRQTPANAVIAADAHTNMIEEYVLLSDRTIALFAEDTLERLLDNGKIADVFRQYGVTHTLGYSAAVTTRLRAAIPSLRVIPPSSALSYEKDVHLTLNYFLHLVR